MYTSTTENKSKKITDCYFYDVKHCFKNRQKLDPLTAHFEK